MPTIIRARRRLTPARWCTRTHLHDPVPRIHPNDVQPNFAVVHPVRMLRHPVVHEQHPAPFRQARPPHQPVRLLRLSQRQFDMHRRSIRQHHQRVRRSRRNIRNIDVLRPRRQRQHRRRHRQRQPCALHHERFLRHAWFQVSTPYLLHPTPCPFVLFTDH